MRFDLQNIFQMNLSLYTLLASVLSGLQILHIYCFHLTRICLSWAQSMLILPETKRMYTFTYNNIYYSSTYAISHEKQIKMTERQYPVCLLAHILASKLP